MLQSFSQLVSILLATLAVTLMLVVLLYFDLQVPVIKLFTWLQQDGWWAPLLFIVLQMLLVVLLITLVYISKHAQHALQHCETRAPRRRG